MIRIISQNGNSPENQLSDILKRVVEDMERNAGKIIADTMTSTVRQHIS